MSSNRQAAAVQLEWQFAVGTDLLAKVDSQGLNTSLYCDLFADQETKESVKKGRNRIKNGPTKPCPN
jgi:hypothetical protein